MNASYDRIGQDVPKTMPLLETHAHRLCARTDEIIKLTSRLNEIANRTFGREPAEIGKATPPVPMPEHSLAKIEDAGSALERAITGLGRAIERFDLL